MRDRKDLLIGVLLGICLTLGTMLVLERGTETAVAGPRRPMGKYQMAVTYGRGQAWIYVLDQDRGHVYFVGEGDTPNATVWRRVIAGAPR